MTTATNVHLLRVDASYLALKLVTQASAVALASILLIADPAVANSFLANVVSVADGDTLTINNDGTQQQVTLEDVDAPEITQPHGEAAQRFTANLCLRKRVEVVQTETEDGKTLVKIKLPNGSDLAENLLRNGWAWYRQKQEIPNVALRHLEESARHSHLGLWQDEHPEPPWEYRKAATAPQSQPLQISVERTAVGVALNAEAASTALLGSAEQGRSAPLQGQIQRAAPMQGAVERTDAAWQGQLERGRFQAAVGQPNTPLQGQLRDSSLQGYVDRNQQQHIDLNALTPSRSGIMRIIQYKPQGATAAQLRTAVPDVVPDHAPVRNLTASDQAPVRKLSADDHPPTRTPLEEQPPQRQMVSSAPQRSFYMLEGAPVRPLYNGMAPGPRIADVPPMRTLVESYTPGRSLANTYQQPRRREIANPGTMLAFAPKTQPNFDTAAKHQRVKAVPQPVLTPEQETLLWDQWYARVNDMVCRALSRTLQTHGNPAGSNRIHITVWPNRNLRAEVVQTSNRSFDAAVVEAYRSLDGNSGLTFPSGTQRSVVDYESAHIQEIPAPTAHFDSSTIQGDRELISKP